ncbi:MAG: hypothetical protein PHH37_13005 [Paludibacter sp.]|nr:hypothetical protein [Paludibacter sp.]
MRFKLFIFISLFFLIAGINAESKKSPHGNKLKTECSVCHTTNGWNVIKPNGFNHNKTHFPLKGQHRMVDCRKCHSSLKFEEAKTECVSCHTDVHEQTLGDDCARCHNTNSWIVTNVRQIHRQKGFPLMGAHATAECSYCHTTASKLRFDNIRSDCYACHQYEYESTTNPNHAAMSFDTDCARCHSAAGRDWTRTGKGFDHSFFPLTGSHNIDCESCHYDNDYSVTLSPQCSSCHSPGPANETYPAHTTVYQSYECNACHNITAWDGGIKFKQHDSWGRIYSGKHKGKWSSCNDCHINDATYQAKCNKCHKFTTGNLP